MKKYYFPKGGLHLLSIICILSLHVRNGVNAQGTSCAAAASLTVNAAAIAGLINDTTINDPTASTCVTGTISMDGWYQFTPVGTVATITVVSNNRQLVVYAYSGICGSLTEIGCANANTTAGGQTETISLTGLTASNTYYVRVGNSGSGSSMTINAISVSSSTPIANDNCPGAITLTPGASCSATSGTTAGATQSIAAIGCNAFTGTADDDVWYKFTATATSHTITVAGGAGFDPVVDLRSGACNGTNINCADATFSGGTETINASGLTIGSQYYVRIYSYGSAASGTFSVCVTTPAALTNDNCSGAVSLTVNPSTACSTSTSGTTIGATQSQAGCLGTADDDVWYSFTATGTSHTVTVTPGTLYDAVLQVFSGTCGGTLTSLGCTDSTVGGAVETATFTGLTAGSTYYVRVYSYSNGTNQGTFSVCVNTFTPLTNDNCSGAAALTINPALTCTTSTSGTTAGATQSQAGCAGTADDDVWYTFTATATSHTISVTPGTLYDAVFQVFSGTCAGTLTSLDCVDDTLGTSAEAASLTGLTVGATYFVRVYSYSSGVNQGTFSICLTTPVPLTNDNCSGAIALTVNATTACTISTTGTTEGASQSQAGCSGTADDDVWYSFVATSTSHIMTVTMGTMYDGVFQVFSGSCGSLTSVACIDNTVGTAAESTILTGLTIGATYFVRIYSYYNLTGDSGTFSVCLTTVIPCTAGSGTGTTSLGCPSVVAGGLGLSGADPSPVSCTSSGCVDLEATYVQLGQTTNYTVESIPYSPPYQFSCLANPVSVNIDDVWSPTVTLPFNFCFYGNTYNQCLVSSNGVISFDLAGNTAGGYSTWSFANNLPNASLFRNSIFGVYHDIDPSKGGKVGWELITLNTGCRALVAAWNDIPMFDCNSSLYTGMIVLYENTNIIEVYIKEKNVCSTWNGGNAIVGVQNAAGTSGIAAPNRNGLDTDWTVTSEAWRFVPSGSSITTIKWHEGSGTAGPVIATTDVVNVCPTATTTYTAEVTYTLCNGTKLIETEETTVTVDMSKVWNGSLGTDWNVAANWTPVGVPTSLDCVVIPNVTNDPSISGASYDAFAYSLKVLNGGFLTLNASNNLTVTDMINVNTGGQFLIKSSGSLLQVNSVANAGIVNIERNTQPVYRFDYTYWNSPVTQASNYTLGALSPNTQYDKYYSWTPSVSGGNGIWAQESVATIMDPSKGYIVRAPNSYSFTPTSFLVYTATFTGTPNNGNIVCPVSYGTLGPANNNDKWNLLGNPYPCAVSAAAFLNDSANALVLDGTIYFWTHNSAISPAFPDPFYGDYVLNYTASDYASWNKTGGVGTAASSGGPAPNGYIASGQSFFVKSLAVPGSATFKNSMRVSDNNSQFYRHAQPGTETAYREDGITERHRIWLNMTNNAGAFNQILIGYVQNATMGWDRGFDGTRKSESDISFYSLIPGEKLVIQGRPIPFEQHDQVPLGFNSSISGDFSIRIDHYDGLFANQDIYLEDKQRNIVHNLKESPYEFHTPAGIFDGRFILRYSDPEIGVDHYGTNIHVTAFLSNHKLNLTASGPIRHVEILDMTGKPLQTIKPSENNAKIVSDFFFPSGVYLAKTELRDGTVKICKIIH